MPLPVGALVQRLEAKGVATDDLWEEAIEASLSFANEVAPPAQNKLEARLVSEEMDMEKNQ
jgi:hypothetical protein